MPREKSDKPWLHAASGFYCVTLAGKRHYLDRDYKIASQKFKRLQKEIKQGRDPATKEWLDAPLLDLVNEFLDDIKAREQVRFSMRFSPEQMAQAQGCRTERHLMSKWTPPLIGIGSTDHNTNSAA